jgi:hypothetical protein
MTSPEDRCGRCSACLTVEATKRIVLAGSWPAGPGLVQRDADLWNSVLADNPCNGDPETGNSIRAREEAVRAQRRAASRTEGRRRAREDRLFFGRDW